MQTYTQTFAAAQTWKMNVPGKYFVLLQCGVACNVRFYLGGKKLDLGDIRQLLAGLEVGPLAGLTAPNAFDSVEIDVQAGDTVQVGIGNGQARYNRANASVTVVNQPNVRFMPTGHSAHYNNNSAVSANTAVEIVAPGINTGGVILLGAEINWFDITGCVQGYVARGSAPAVVTDGMALLTSSFDAYQQSSGGVSGSARLPMPLLVPAGLGIYFISSAALAGIYHNYRSARWLIL